MPQKPYQEYTVDYDTLMREAKGSLARANALSAEVEPPAPVSPPDHYDSLEPVKRLFRNMKEAVLPTDRWSDVGEGLSYSVRHPIEAAKLVYGADRDARAVQAEKAKTAPSLLEKLGHTAASYLPVIGPAAAGAGEQLAEGDIAGGIGKTAGLLAPFAVSAILPKGPKGRPIARVPDFEGGELNPALVRPEPFGPQPAPKPKVTYPRSGSTLPQLRDMLGVDPQSFEAPEKGVGTPLESYTDSRPRFPYRPDVNAPTSVPAEGFDPYFPNSGASIADSLADARPRIPFRGDESVTPLPESPLPPGFEELNRIINAPEGRLVKPERAPLAPPQTDVHASISDALSELRQPEESAPAPIQSPELPPSEPVVQEPAPFIDSEPAPTSNKPRITADEFAGILRGREKFKSANPDAELPPGMRDELDRSGLEYNRTQSELKKLLGMPDADPAEVSRMRHGARELGSRLRNTAKSATEPPAPSEPPPPPPSSLKEMLQASLKEQANDSGLPPEREGHFNLPDPGYILPESEQLKFLEKTKERADRRYNSVNDRRTSDVGRVEGDRRAPAGPSPEDLGRTVEPGAPYDPTVDAPLPQEVANEFAPDNALSRLLNDEAGRVDLSELKPTPEKMKRLGAMAQAHQAGSLLFKPLILAKILASNTTSALMKSFEHAATERSMAPVGRTLKELLNVKQMGADAIDAFKNPHTKYSRDSVPYPSGGLFGVASRAVGAVDAPFRNAMERAGFPAEDALTVTQQRSPITEFGKGAVRFQQGSTASRLLMPFLKAGMNSFETGIVEPVQSAGRLAFGEGSAADAVKVGSAATAGAAGYFGADKLDELPAYQRALILALGGLYNVPAGVGYAGAHAKDGFQGAYDALIRSLPLASGFSMDPKTQLNRVVPQTLNPDYWTGTQRKTTSLPEKLEAQIPGLAQQLPVKPPTHKSKRAKHVSK